MDHIYLLVLTGLLAGSMNAVAGGGSFITFPAMVFAGVPPVTANASSTVALFPGSVISSWEYRSFIKPFQGVSLGVMAFLTFVGGCAGAFLLLVTPAADFNALVPWLLLTGTLAFAFGKRVGAYLSSRFQISPSLVLCSQFFLGIYGGYFGGAVGIMMMAVWSIFGLSDIKVINANKNLLVGVANSIAVFVFIAAEKVSWPETGVMMLATIAGGYLGARYSRKMDPVQLRKGIVVFNFVITFAFFVRVYGQ